MTMASSLLRYAEQKINEKKHLNERPALVAVWLSGNALALINVVALRRARLVVGWVTIRGYTILVFDQATQTYSAWPSLCG